MILSNSTFHSYTLYIKTLYESYENKPFTAVYIKVDNKL